jgi:MazG family protein
MTWIRSLSPTQSAQEASKRMPPRHPKPPRWDREPADLFLRLLSIVGTLRSPDGCPWDQEQSPKTIAPYLVEEAHEVLEAVESGDPKELCDELGDVLLEVALLAQMAAEQGQFTVADSLRSICDKLIRRHPHVFGEGECRDAESVRQTWAQIKAQERSHRGALEGVPRRLPALHRARRVSDKAGGVGFDWPDASQVLEKVEEELTELRATVACRESSRSEEELGDLLFALVNLGRHIGVDAEAALHRATEKFLRRFAQVEQALAARGRHPSDSTIEEMELLWEQAKSESPDPEPPGDDPQ